MRVFSFLRTRYWLGAIVSLCFATAASALPSVDVYFTRLNVTPIVATTDLRVAPGDRVQVEMRIATDARGVSVYSLSVDFDSAGDGRLDLLGFTNLVPPELILRWVRSRPSGPTIRGTSRATSDPSPAPPSIPTRIRETRS